MRQLPVLAQGKSQSILCGTCPCLQTCCLHKHKVLLMKALLKRKRMANACYLFPLSAIPVSL